MNLAGAETLPGRAKRRLTFDCAVSQQPEGQTLPSIGRRAFVGSLLVGGAGILSARSFGSADARIEVLLHEPIGIVSPEIYGHFIEHLGGVIYNGVWVGEQSKIANIGGIRRVLVEHLLKVKPGVVRWPGGCFADSYDWRDGVGERASRPRRTNFWISEEGNENSPSAYESNEFGTHEFMRFCKLIGAPPYLAANVRSLPARDFYQWVEYCNAPAGSTELAKLRAAGGNPDPFNVRYWAVGNEADGCGGNMMADQYADEFRKFVTWVPTYGTKPAFIAVGPNGGDWRWTRTFFSRMIERCERRVEMIYGWALHYYCGSNRKSNALDFTQEEWYQLLAEADRMESLINMHWSVMGEIDTRHRVKLVVDEWGALNGRSADMPQNYLFAYPGTLREALVAALTLDTFNRHADKVVMANIAQLINSIQCLFLAYEDRFVATPNYHVFEMYSAHQGGQSVRTIFSSPTVDYKAGDKTSTLWGLNGSASLRDKQLVLTVVNPHHKQARDTEIAIRGATINSGQSRTLSSTDLHAHNSFAEPHALEPKDAPVTASGSVITFQFPPASVTRMILNIG